MKLFISYSRDDKAWVYELWRVLRDEGQHDAWIDRHLAPAQDWWGTILDSIDGCECFLYVMTPKSVESIYCGAELDYALALNKPVLPLMLKSCDFPPTLSQRRVQYQMISDEMNLDRVLFKVGQGLTEVRVGLVQGKYPPQHAPRPDVPTPQKKPEQVSEVYTLAEESVEHNFARAEQLFQQVMAVDPQGWGVAAAERLGEIRFERLRAAEYLNIVQMASNLALIRGARSAARVFIRAYPDYDPNQIFPGLLNQVVTPPPPVRVQQAPTTPLPMPAEAESYRPANDPTAEADTLSDTPPPVEVQQTAATPPPMPAEAESYRPANDPTAEANKLSDPPPLLTFIGHELSVKSVAFSPDGKQVLTGSYDATARLWNVATGQTVQTFRGSSLMTVSSVAFSPDGKQVLTGSKEHSALLWDVATGRMVHQFWDFFLHLRDSMTNSVAFSPDGKQVLTGSNDNTARLWLTPRGSRLHTFGGHTKGVTSVAFSPDGKQVLTGSLDGTARLWDAATGQTVLIFSSASVSSVAFSPDGKQVLIGSWDGNARLWDVATRQLVYTFSGQTTKVSSVAFSPDGKRVLTGNLGGTAWLWDVTTSQTVHTFSGHTDQVTSVAFSPDGKQVLTGSYDHTARLWAVP